MFLVMFLGSFWTPNCPPKGPKVGQNDAQNANSISDRFFDAFMVDFLSFFWCFFEHFQSRIPPGGKRCDIEKTSALPSGFKVYGWKYQREMCFYFMKLVPKTRLANYVILNHVLVHIWVTVRPILLPKTSKSTI